MKKTVNRNMSGGRSVRAKAPIAPQERLASGLKRQPKKHDPDYGTSSLSVGASNGRIGYNISN